MGAAYHCGCVEQCQDTKSVSSDHKKTYYIHTSEVDLNSKIDEKTIEKYQKQKLKSKKKQQESDPPPNQQESDPTPKQNGIVIGGNDAEQDPEIIQQLMTDAAEKRMLQANNRGISSQAQIDYEFKLKKQQELEKYESERRGEQYALKWK